MESKTPNADGSAKPRVVDDGLPLWRVRTLAHLFSGGSKSAEEGHAGAGAPADHPQAARAAYGASADRSNSILRLLLAAS